MIHKKVGGYTISWKERSRKVGGHEYQKNNFQRKLGEVSMIHKKVGGYTISWKYRAKNIGGHEKSKQ